MRKITCHLVDASQISVLEQNEKVSPSDVNKIPYFTSRTNTATLKVHKKFPRELVVKMSFSLAHKLTSWPNRRTAVLLFSVSLCLSFISPQGGDIIKDKTIRQFTCESTDSLRLFPRSTIRGRHTPAVKVRILTWWPNSETITRLGNLTMLIVNSVICIGVFNHFLN